MVPSSLILASNAVLFIGRRFKSLQKMTKNIAIKKLLQIPHAKVFYYFLPEISQLEFSMHYVLLL